MSFPYTYVNEPMNVKSTRDYLLTSEPLRTVAFNTTDLDINLSDHLPIMAIFLCEIEECRLQTTSLSDNTYFRWDHDMSQSIYTTTVRVTCYSRCLMI